MATFTTNTEPELESQGVLASWKRIAAYFGCNVRTAKRWERERGLPVRRAPGKKSGTVFARTSELDTWLESREETQMLDSAVSKGGKVGRLAAVAQNNSKPVATTLLHQPLPTSIGQSQLGFRRQSQRQRAAAHPSAVLVKLRIEHVPQTSLAAKAPR